MRDHPSRTVRPGILPAAAAAWIAAAAPAQELCWRLPPGGAAEFRRTWSARSGVAESVAAARAVEPRGAVPERFLSRLVPAPWLCQGELDERQQAIQDPPRDLRDVVRAVALDLGARGSGNWRFLRVVPFGDLAVRGRVDRPAADGTQEMRLQIEARRPGALPGEPRELRAEHVVPLCTCDARGELSVLRRVDAEAGLVREYAAELDLIVDEGTSEGAAHRIVLQDAWQLVAVRENQDADFRVRVTAAVRAGAEWLHGTLSGFEASFLQDGGEEQRSFGSGRIALAALTLLHAGVPADDPVVAGAFATLRRRKLVDTYSLATALMAMARLHAPPREAELVRSGQIGARQQRQLGDRDLRAATRWVERMLDNRDERADPAECLRFNYAGGSRYDNSLTQYALLGLDAAALCGVELPAGTWRAAANHFLAVQGPAGREVPLLLTTHRELAAGEVSGRARRAAPRGFAYQYPHEPAYGGMTTAGIAGLVLARAGLLREGAADAELRAIDLAIDAGFAWLAQEFTVRANPGFVGKADRHWYYWLYGLERACELAGIARVQGRDWYYEGALQLLSQQQANGSFRADRAGTLLLDATCFAVLFLQKATLAVITGR